MRGAAPFLALIAAAALGASGHARGSEPTLAEEAAFRAAVGRVAAAVVRIEPLALTTTRAGGEAAVGSGPSTGLAIAPGRVLATAFAVPDDVDAAVVVLPDGGRRAATVRGRDHSRGLVLLAVEDLPDPPTLEPLPRRALHPGQWAIAVGRAWNAATPSLAVGIVSAVDRAWGKGVQTDAAVSPMNYGGPLIDIAGRVIGVVAPLPADTAGLNEGTELYDSGIGFAVPLEDILAVLPRLERGESLAPGILGIGYRSRDVINGEPLVGSVRQGSPAARAGLRPGDRIVRIDGRDVARVADARHAIAPRYAGDTIAVVVERDAGGAQETVEAEATLVDTLPAWRRAVIGVVAAARPGTGQGGLDVGWVLPGGPAARAGLEAGDRLDAITPNKGGTAIAIDGPDAAAGVLAGVEPGAVVSLSVTRGSDAVPLEVTTILMPGDVPAQGQPPGAPAVDPAAGPADPVDVVRLEAAEVAAPPLAVVPRGGGAVGVLVWFGPPHGRATDAEADAWKPAAARHGIAVILPGSAAADAWSAGDVATVTRAIASLNARRRIDPSRIGLAGSGAGAAFAWLVADRLGSGVGGVALVDAPLPRRASVDPAAPGTARWILLGPGDDDATRQRVAADRERLERAGHAVGLFPASAGQGPPADLLCRWVAVLGLL